LYLINKEDVLFYYHFNYVITEVVSTILEVMTYRWGIELEMRRISMFIHLSFEFKHTLFFAWITAPHVFNY